MSKSREEDYFCIIDQLYTVSGNIYQILAPPVLSIPTNTLVTLFFSSNGAFLPEESENLALPNFIVQK